MGAVKEGVEDWVWEDLEVEADSAAEDLEVEADSAAEVREEVADSVGEVMEVEADSVGEVVIVLCASTKLLEGNFGSADIGSKATCLR